MGLSVNQYRQIFVEHGGLLSAEAFDAANTLHTKTHRSLNEILLEQSMITGSQFLQLIGSYFDVPAISLGGDKIDIAALQTVPEDFANKHLAIAFARDETSLSVAFERPDDEQAIEQLESFVNLSVKPYVALTNELQQALILYKGDLQERIINAAAVFDEAKVSLNSAHSAIALVDAIIESAVFMGASDIHIEPYETELLVRFRIDGQLRTIAALPTTAAEPLQARIKILGELRVDQKRLPQDGRFSLSIKDQEINFRVSTVPSLWGEKTVIRVLLKAAHLFDLASIGLQENDLNLIRSYINRPHGMILITGPTGSGKTTTLYSFMQEVARERIDIVNISTIEDPIEYTIPRVTQIQTQPDINLTFATGLRALLRQDPDILMVGEIRDEETADFAVRAALVGRLLMSSLHTNDAPSTIPRLLDMGIEPYLLSSVLTLVIAQRLARKLCIYCRQSYHPDQVTLAELNEQHGFSDSLQRLQAMNLLASGDQSDLRFFESHGCEHCNQTGYQGRIGIFEVLQLTPDLQKAVSQRLDSNQIRMQAIKGGMKTMFEDGITKLLSGAIDLHELLRAVYS